MSTPVVYRFYGADGALLHVGRTVNPGARFATHAREKSWWSEVVRIEVEHQPSVEEMVRSEARQIAPTTAEQALADEAGVTRLTVRKALGK